MLKYLDQNIIVCITDYRILRFQEDFPLDVPGVFTIHNLLVDLNHWHWDCLKIQFISTHQCKDIHTSPVVLIVDKGSSWLVGPSCDCSILLTLVSCRFSWLDGSCSSGSSMVITGASSLFSIISSALGGLLALVSVSFSTLKIKKVRFWEDNQKARWFVTTRSILPNPLLT